MYSFTSYGTKPLDWKTLLNGHRTDTESIPVTSYGTKPMVTMDNERTQGPFQSHHMEQNQWSRWTTNGHRAHSSHIIWNKTNGHDGQRTDTGSIPVTSYVTKPMVTMDNERTQGPFQSHHMEQNQWSRWTTNGHRVQSSHIIWNKTNSHDGQRTDTGSNPVTSYGTKPTVTMDNERTQGPFQSHHMEQNQWSRWTTNGHRVHSSHIIWNKTNGHDGQRTDTGSIPVTSYGTKPMVTMDNERTQGLFQSHLMEQNQWSRWTTNGHRVYSSHIIWSKIN